MPKLKRHKGLAKRMRIGKRGRVKRSAAGKSHLMSGKPAKTRRKLKRKRTVSAADAPRIKRLMLA